MVRDSTVVVCRHGREIVVYPGPHYDPQVLSSLLPGRLMASLFRQRGWLPLHASAVVVGHKSSGPNNAALFLGESGYGKSTTAAAFHAKGYEVITDDIAVVSPVGNVCLVRPAWAKIRLTEDSMGVLDGHSLPSSWHIDKHSVELGHGRLRRLFRVGRIYVLRYGNELEAVRLHGANAVAALDQFSFPRRRQTGRDFIQSAIELCSAVAVNTEVHELYRKRSLASLGDLVEFVSRDLKNNG